MTLDLNTNNKKNFKHYFSNSEHGVYALHGHIFDSFNYEGSSLHTTQDYKLVPIGDPITTEMLIKIPYKLMQKIESADILDEKEKVQLRKNFQEIGNIRPYSAIFRWLLFQIKVNINLKEIIEETIDEVMHEFKDLKFVKNWYKKHDTLHPLDIADKIQYITLGLEKCKILPMKKIPGFIVDWIIKKINSDYDIEGALKLFHTLDDNIHYVIMGYTHIHLQQSLFVNSSKHQRIRESVYLNTGTWIKNYYECKDKKGFIGWKNMNYIIIYTPKEKPNRYKLPVFETWQGNEKRYE